MKLNLKSYIETEGRERWVGLGIGPKHFIYGQKEYPKGYRYKFKKQIFVGRKWIEKEVI